LRSPAALASPAAADRSLGDADVASVQRQVADVVATADLPGLESLLLDHVSMATPDGGQVLDRAAAAGWLRDHAGRGISVSRVDRGTQTVMLQVLTIGWPTNPPLQAGQVTLSLRRYDANGRPDEDNGAWRIDVIDAE
jgi:hypothetical protein